MKKTANFIFLALFIGCFASHLFAQTGPSPYASDILLIRFEENVPEATINHLMQQYGAVELGKSRVSKVRKWQIVSFPTPAPNYFIEINEVIQHANSQAEVTGAGLNYSIILPPSFTFPGGGNAGTCGYEFACTPGTTPVKVGVFDTGVSYHCPGLATYFDPARPGYDFVNEDHDPADDHGHGTHIAGIIAMVAKMEPQQHFELVAYKTHDQEGRADLFTVIRAADQAVLDGVQILNMSFSYYASSSPIPGAYELKRVAGGPGPVPGVSIKKAPLQIAIDVASVHEVLVLVSAGNRGQDNDKTLFPAYPASFNSSNIITVASTDCQHKLSYFSNWGEGVHIAAPGESITSTNLDCGTIQRTGTSQAVAFATGVAMRISTHSSPAPFSYNRVKCAMLKGAALSPFLMNKVECGGVVNAPESLKQFLQGQCTAVKERNNETDVIPASGKLSINPNPFSTTLQLQFKAPTDSPSTINIFDAQGRLVLTKNWAADSHSDQMSFSWTPEGIPSGIYYIQLNTPDRTIVSKAIYLP